MPSPTNMRAKRANRTTISHAVRAADRGVSTTIEASTWMSLEAALSVAFKVLDDEAYAGFATVYVTGDVLYIGPKKSLEQSR